MSTVVEDSGKKWYVVRSVNGKEKKVKEFIEIEIQRAGLESLVEEVLIPTEKVYQLRNGKKVAKERNYYPGYVLIKASLEGEIPHLIKGVTNVIGFLGSEKGGDPVPLRQSEVNRILKKVDDLADADVEFDNPYTVGDKVKVIDGPFNNFDGVIEEINEEKRRLKVMVKIFGRKTPVELNYMQVEMVK